MQQVGSTFNNACRNSATIVISLHKKQNKVAVIYASDHHLSIQPKIVYRLNASAASYVLASTIRLCHSLENTALEGCSEKQHSIYRC